MPNRTGGCQDDRGREACRDGDWCWEFNLLITTDGECRLGFIINFFSFSFLFSLFSISTEYSGILLFTLFHFDFCWHDPIGRNAKGGAEVLPTPPSYVLTLTGPQS